MRTLDKNASKQSQIERLYRSVVKSGELREHGFTTSHTVEFVTLNREVLPKNIDTDAFTRWAHQLTGIKYTTIERYLRQLKAKSKSVQG